MKFPISFLFSFLLFLFCVSLSRADLRANYELTYVKEESRFLGEAIFELEREGTYEFSLRGIRLREFNLNGEVPKYDLRGERLRIQNPRKNSKLVILFERELPIKRHLQIQLEVNYLPWPTQPTIFEITIKGFHEELNTLLIPSEEDERTADTLVFRTKRPILAPPPIIVGRFRESKISLTGNEIRLLHLRRIEESELKNFERTLDNILLKLSQDERTLLFPYQRMYFLLHNERAIYPFLISDATQLKTEEQIKFFVRSTFKHTLLFSLGFKNEMLIDGLTTFFTDYKLSTNRTHFRRELLLSRAPEGISFFLIFETIGSAREQEFFSVVRDFLLQSLYSSVREEVFLRVLNEKLGGNFSMIFEPERRCPVFINPKAWMRPLGKDELFQIDLILSSKDCFRVTQFRIQILTAKGISEYTILWDTKQKTFSFNVKGKPLYLLIDPEYEIYRYLQFDEKVPPLEAVFRGKGLIYLPKQELYPLYRELIQSLLEEGHSLRYGLPQVSELPRENLIFLDSPPLGFHLDSPREGFFFSFMPHPEDPSKHIAFFRSNSLGELREALKVKERWKGGRYAHLKRGRIVALQEAEGVLGIMLNLSNLSDTPGYRLADVMSLERLVIELLPSQVILIGEQHDHFGCHLFQLELIKQLRAIYPKVAIGLEMIQRPFQQYLDEFVEGRISERDLLEKTEYFERWGYDWRLYRDIFLYAKENKIKLVALDMPQELVKKVSKSGLQSLTREEKLLLPELDLHNPPYEQYLRKIFSLHHFSNETKFEYFYQAQVLRDEGMAERIIEFLRRHPDYKLVVLVGNGHIKEGMGIPHALRRRNFKNFRTIFLGYVPNPSPNLADYWFLPKETEYERTPSLGIVLNEVESGLIISAIREDSLAKKADLRMGDKLLKVDNMVLKKMSQLRLILTFKKPGDKIRLTIEREGRILEKEVILE